MRKINIGFHYQNVYLEDYGGYFNILDFVKHIPLELMENAVSKSADRVIGYGLSLFSHKEIL